MANTFSQIYLHFVFAVRHRESLIASEHKIELQKYITCLVQNRNAKMLAIHCMPDHTHILAGLKPIVYIPDFVKEIKVESGEFINNKHWTRKVFRWQEGYGVFSYSQSQVSDVIKYIENQELHHKKKTFRHEYEQMLRKFDISFEEKYLFNFSNQE